MVKFRFAARQNFISCLSKSTAEIKARQSALAPDTKLKVYFLTAWTRGIFNTNLMAGRPVQLNSIWVRPNLGRGWSRTDWRSLSQLAWGSLWGLSFCSWWEWQLPWCKWKQWWSGIYQFLMSLNHGIDMWRWCERYENNKARGNIDNNKRRWWIQWWLEMVMEIKGDNFREVSKQRGHPDIWKTQKTSIGT